MKKKVIALTVLSLSLSVVPVFGIDACAAKDYRTATLCSSIIADGCPETLTPDQIHQIIEKYKIPIQEKEPAPGTQVPTKEETPTGSVLPFEKEVFNLVNIERSKNGLAALQLDIAVTSVARTKSQDMAINNYFAHQSPTYGSAGEMLKNFKVEWTAWGENIASGQKTPQDVVTAWMNSEGHRANILNSNFTKIGIGYATDSNGKSYWTQMFVK